MTYLFSLGLELPMLDLGRCRLLLLGDDRWSCGPISDSFLSLPISDALLFRRIESSAALPSWSGTMMTYKQNKPGHGFNGSLCIMECEELGIKYSKGRKQFVRKNEKTH
jgi:hypothetical protein